MTGRAQADRMAPMIVSLCQDKSWRVRSDFCVCRASGYASWLLLADDWFLSDRYMAASKFCDLVKSCVACARVCSFCAHTSASLSSGWPCSFASSTEAKSAFLNEYLRSTKPPPTPSVWLAFAAGALSVTGWPHT